MTIRILLLVTLATSAIGNHCNARDLDTCNAFKALDKQETSHASLKHDQPIQQIELDATDIFRKHFPGAHALVANDDELRQMSEDLQRRIDDQFRADSRSGKPRSLSTESRKLRRMLYDVGRVRSSRAKHKREESMRQMKKRSDEFQRKQKIEGQKLPLRRI